MSVVKCHNVCSILVCCKDDSNICLVHRPFGWLFTRLCDCTVIAFTVPMLFLGMLIQPLLYCVSTTSLLFALFPKTFFGLDSRTLEPIRCTAIMSVNFSFPIEITFGKAWVAGHHMQCLQRQELLSGPSNLKCLFLQLSQVRGP